MSGPQHTLFLWIRGAFPRRIAYQLLHKGIVASASDLLSGHTVVPNFSINVATISFTDGNFSMGDADPSDPKPQGKSSPALRVKYSDGAEKWIHESTAIAFYIEDTFPEFKSAVGKDVVDRALALDMVTLTNLLVHNSSYYIRHATAVTEMWSGLANEDRSHQAALNALASMNKDLVKLQDWAAANSLDETGWLTPGMEGSGPGIVDFGLAGNLRYMQLGFEFDMLEDERLGRLREWWKKFQGLPWWEAMEETGEVHSPEMSFSKDIREV